MSGLTIDNVGLTHDVDTVPNLFIVRTSTFSTTSTKKWTSFMPPSIWGSSSAYARTPTHSMPSDSDDRQRKMRLTPIESDCQRALARAHLHGTVPKPFGHFSCYEFRRSKPSLVVAREGVRKRQRSPLALTAKHRREKIPA